MQLTLRPSLELIRITMFMHVSANAVLRAGLGRCCGCISIRSPLLSVTSHSFRSSIPHILSGLRFTFRAPSLLSLLDTAISPAVTEPRAQAACRAQRVSDSTLEVSPEPRGLQNPARSSAGMRNNYKYSISRVPLMSNALKFPEGFNGKEESDLAGSPGHMGV